MKRGTPEHRKMHILADSLKLRLYSAVGIMEMVWHFAGKYTPQGDIGSVPDRRIAAAVDWEKKPEILIDALVKSEWLDRHDAYRLIVHDWPEHCEQAVRKLLLRNRKNFLPIYADCTAGVYPLSGQDPDTVLPSREARLGSVVSKSEKEKNQEVSEIWHCAGFSGPEEFEVWWLQVVENHPNRTKNTYAKSELFELIINRHFTRDEFECGYSQLRESKADDWTKDAGKYCTNLYEIVHNRLWKFKAEVKEDWVRELEQEQALERRQTA